MHLSSDREQEIVGSATSRELDRVLASPGLLEVLAELNTLLEEHAPLWYSDEQRHRVLTSSLFPVEVLLELCALLEDYAPNWYTEQHRDRIFATLRNVGLLHE